MTVLDVGCGRRRVTGSIGIDLHRGADAAVRGDVRRLPVRDHSADAVHLSNVLEHFRHPELVLAEMHRVLKPGGYLHIRLPHYTSPAAHSNPDHRWCATLQTLRLWAEDGPRPRWQRWLYRDGECVDAAIARRRWRLVSRRLAFHWLPRLLGIEALANAYPELWEASVGHLIPARSIEAVLEPLPEPPKEAAP